MSCRTTAIGHPQTLGERVIVGGCTANVVSADRAVFGSSDARRERSSRQRLLDRGQHDIPVAVPKAMAGVVRRQSWARRDEYGKARELERAAPGAEGSRRNDAMSARTSGAEAEGGAPSPAT